MPCIRGLRIPVATVVGMVAEGMKEDEILQLYPDLEREDISVILFRRGLGRHPKKQLSLLLTNLPSIQNSLEKRQGDSSINVVPGLRS